MEIKYYNILKDKKRDRSKINLLFKGELKDISNDVVSIKLEEVLKYHLFSYYEKKEICRYIYSYTKNLEFKKKYFYYTQDKYRFYCDFNEILSMKLYDIAFKILEDNIELIKNDIKIKNKILVDLFEIDSLKNDTINFFFIDQKDDLINRYYNLLVMFINKEFKFKFYKSLYEWSLKNKDFKILDYLKESNIVEDISDFQLLEGRIKKTDEELRTIVFKMCRDITKYKITDVRKNQIISALNFIENNQPLHKNSIDYIEGLRKNMN